MKLKRLVLLLLIALSLPVKAYAALTDDQYQAIQYDAVYDDASLSGACTAGGGGTQLIGAENPEKVYRFLLGKGLTAIQAAGVTGNLMLESGGNVDIKPDAVSGAGYRGIAQWDGKPGGRWERLANWAHQNGRNELDLATQLDYMWLEATDRGNIDGLKQQTDIPHAAWYWGRFFEGAIINGNTSTTPLTNVQALEDRTKDAQQVFNQYGTVSAGAPGAGTTASATVIALDPGHGGEVAEYTDAVTKLKDRETANNPERADVLDVANRIKTKLDAAGYNVVLLRTGVTEAINKRDRVNKAIAAKANMVISLHTTPGGINQVWPQRTGKYRENLDGSNRTTFTNTTTAQASEKYANIMAQERTKAEGHTVTTDPGQAVQSDSFSRDGLPSQGNISLVQLWSPDIPWVYNEIGQDVGTAISESLKQAYADGVSNAVRAALPTTGASTSANSCGYSGDTSGVVGTAVNYSWPDYRGTGYITMKPEYAEAVAVAKQKGQYIGGVSFPGVDCGGFVTRVMVNSGFEPHYNYDADGGNTAYQLSWARKNWTRLGKISSTSQLQAGDVAFRINSDGSNDGHTFMWVGDTPGFDSSIASSSLDERAPMAGRENPVANNIEWYRKR